MDNTAFIFIGVWLVFVCVLIFVILKAQEKRRKLGIEKLEQSIKSQIQYVQDQYIKEPGVKFAYASSNNSMCRTIDDKVKEVAKNIAKATVRTALTGRASYRGSDIGNRHYLIGYGNQKLYFFYVYDSNIPREMSFNEDEFFAISKSEIKNIIIKNKKSAIIYLDLQNGARIGFQLTNKLLGVEDFNTKNAMFKEYIEKELLLLSK